MTVFGIEWQMDLGLIRRIAEGPAWVYWWTRVIDVSNWMLIAFAFRDVRAHWALTAWFANVCIILTLFGTFGYGRWLGLSHILVWTPLWIYLVRTLQPFSSERVSGRYLYWFLAVISISLAFDYVDLCRWLLG